MFSVFLNAKGVLWRKNVVAAASRGHAAAATKAPPSKHNTFVVVGSLIFLASKVLNLTSYICWTAGVPACSK